MKRAMYCLLLLTAMSSLQGCFWHSTEVDREVPADHTTTVVNPPPGSTVTTTNP